MFIPPEFKFTDRQDQIAFMQQYNFAAIIAVQHGLPIATHLPVHIKEVADKIVISAHFAIANSMVPLLDGCKLMLIFCQPHAYISPSHYAHSRNVPTWNYIAVHAYGLCKVLHSYDDKIRVLEELMQVSEPEYLQQWQVIDPTYRDALLNGIVPVEIEIDNINAIAKLSQNKTEQERNNITEALLLSADGAARDLAKHMCPHLQTNNKAE